MSGSPRLTLAPVASSVATPGAAREFAVRLDPAFAGFEGHFPGSPVLPGVCLVDLAVRAAALASGREVLLASVERARFLRKARPGEELRVVVEVAGSQVRAVITVAGETVSEMTLGVTPPA